MNIAGILADGMINSSEVEQIKSEIMSDGVVSREEANQLFELKDKATSTCPEFNEFFVESITNHIKGDGVVTEEEVEWFKSRVAVDGEIDELEKKIAENCGIQL